MTFFFKTEVICIDKPTEKILRSSINKEILRKEQEKEEEKPKKSQSPTSEKTVFIIDRNIRNLARMCAKIEKIHKRLWVEDLILKKAYEEYGIMLEGYEERIK